MLMALQIEFFLIVSAFLFRTSTVSTTQHCVCFVVSITLCACGVRLLYASFETNILAVQERKSLVAEWKRGPFVAYTPRMHLPPLSALQIITDIIEHQCMMIAARNMHR